MPVANPVCNRSVPKLPIPPKSQKIPGARNKTNTGIHLVFLRRAEGKWGIDRHVSSELQSFLNTNAPLPGSCWDGFERGL